MHPEARKTLGFFEYAQNVIVRLLFVLLDDDGSSICKFLCEAWRSLVAAGTVYP